MATNTGFVAWDWVIFSVSIVASLGVGIWAAFVGRRRLVNVAAVAAANDFMTGGRDINFVAVALSTLIGAMSSVVIMGQ